MMKDYLLSITKLLALTIIAPLQSYAAQTPATPASPTTSTQTQTATTNTAAEGQLAENFNKDPQIKAFLQQESQNITSDFPYRVNLYTQGQITKNKAGARFAETANQLSSDTSGLLFFYDLVTNAMRVPHWHANAKEIGSVIEGKMRITIWEGSGIAKVFTVEKNGTWIIPKATLHALENIGNDKMKFVVVYDSPIAADKDFVTAWASLPNAILARSVGLSEKDIASIKKSTIDRLSSFDPAALPEKTDEYNTLANSFTTAKPLYESELGSITRIDQSINPIMKEMALQRTLMKPKALRIPHWYTSGDVLLFVYKGYAFFTLMNDEGKIYHTIIKPGDVISIPIGNFHSFLNIGNEELEIYEAFNNANDINEITLMNGVQHFGVGTMQGAIGLSQDLIKKIKEQKPQSFIMAF